MLNKKIILTTFLTTLLLISILSTQTAYATTDPAVSDLTGTDSSDSTGLTSGNASTTTLSTAVNGSSQRKSFYYNGRWWVFYSDGTNMVYRTSLNGSGWTAASAAVRACTSGEQFSIWFNGTHVFYGYGAGANTALYYRCGLPSSDGTISWSAAETAVVAAPGAGRFQTYCGIAVDDSWHALIAYTSDKGTKGTILPQITRNDDTDGTWTTTATYPKTLNATHQASYNVVVIPLTGGKYFCMYSWAGGSVYGTAWTGAAFKAEVSTPSVANTGGYMSCVNQSDDVHIVFANSTSINYVKYTYSSNTLSSSETIVQSTNKAPVLSIDPDTNILYCFWAGSPTANHIYYKRCISGTWDTDPTDWITETALTLTRNNHISCFYQAYRGKMGLMYMTKDASPYNIKVACVQNNYDITGYTGVQGLQAGDDASSIAFVLKLNNTFPAFRVSYMNTSDKYEINFTIGNQFVIDFVATSNASAGKVIIFYKSGGVWVAGDSLTQSSIASGTLYSSASGNVSFKLTDYSSSGYGTVELVVSKDYLHAHAGVGSSVTAISGASYIGSLTSTNPGEDGGTKKDRSPSGSVTASYTLTGGDVSEFPSGMLLLAIPVIAIYLFLRKRSAIRFSMHGGKAT